MKETACHNSPAFANETNAMTKVENAIKQTAMHFFNDRYVIRFH